MPECLRIRAQDGFDAPELGQWVDRNRISG